MNSGPAFSQIRMAADSELRYYFSCLMLGDSRDARSGAEYSIIRFDLIYSMIKWFPKTRIN